MALLMLAVAGGVTFLAWKTVTMTTKWVLLTLLISFVVDDVLFEQADFGLFELGASALIAGMALGVA